MKKTREYEERNANEYLRKRRNNSGGKEVRNEEATIQKNNKLEED